MELTRSKISVDRLLLRQKEGFLSVLPTGNNAFGAQYERVLPSSSAANLYPLNYSGKTDSNGFYIGRDKFGANILVDFDKRTDDKTNSNVLILGNSGQGKSYLMKLLLCNMRESGKSIICLDPESEYEDLCNNLGGTYIDMMSGEYMINPLEPKAFGDADKNDDAPDTFRRITRLSQHISYLKDFFRAYKDFTDSEIDTLEIMLIKLYARFGIDDNTDYSELSPTDYPTMSDLYELVEDFLLPEIREFTKPLMSIPTHNFFFNVGNISPAEFMDMVQLLRPEYDLIAHPERGTCIYRCGNEQYLLQVHAPEYKEKLFGKAGGR